MYLRPARRDVRAVVHHLGTIATGLSLMMAAPAVLALFLREWNAAAALVTGGAIAFGLGQLIGWRAPSRTPLTLAQGTVVVALGWLGGSVLAAVPLLLSGHVDGFLDAWFEAMSGLTTSGLSVVQDVDHLAYSMSVYRHLTHFVGGQGIVIVVLAIASAGGGQLGTLYVAEARDERILPSIVRTARFIFLVAAVYLAVGTVALTAAIASSGVAGWRALYHAVTLFFAAFDTGGFSPTSRSIAYYHSLSVEVVLIVLMVAGTVSFAVHYQLWHRRFDPVVRDTELRTLGLTSLALTAIAVFGLAAAGAYGDATGLFRKGVFTVVSAHSGTGFAVTDGTLLLTDWGTLAPAAVVFAMAFGGMAGSTAGGIKAIRIGLSLRGLVREVRRLLLPPAAYVVTTYVSGRRRVLRPAVIRGAIVVLLLYALTYLGGAAAGLLYERWGVQETLFESVSAAANVGLSVGIVGPDMPRGLQAVYLVQMWLGRLEFMAAFALLGTVYAALRRGITVGGRR